MASLYERPGQIDSYLDSDGGLGECVAVRRSGSLGLVLAVACAATGTAMAAPRPLPLSARVIQPGEFPGFLALPGQSTTLYKSPKQWVSVDTNLTPAQVSARTARLRREGFVALLSRQLGTQTPEPWGGLSWVMQLRSAASARAELAANVRDAASMSKPPKRSYTAFPVGGIPGARGYHLTSPGGVGDNVLFADGPFVYFVGFGWSGNPKSRPTRAQLLAAATRVYKRIHGHPPA
jgi:hypothetical protein